MATTEFGARIKHKRDTSANWTSSNPVILDGEIIIVETASGEVRRKIGDGVKRYSELPFDDEAVRNLIDTMNVFVAQSTAPSKTNILWIDTSVGGVLKYHNGTAWVATASVWG